MRIRIAWQSKITGAEGHGQWFGASKRDYLSDLIEKLNRVWPDLDHWIEENSDDR